MDQSLQPLLNMLNGADFPSDDEQRREWLIRILKELAEQGGLSNRRTSASNG